VTERASRQNINKMLKGKTVVIVAQKINTIKEADQIIVLDSGCIVGKGTHEELLANCETYQEIYATQCYVEKEEA
jgi:ATP-binding cassette, subfamily B, multidrug efflux pump